MRYFALLLGNVLLTAHPLQAQGPATVSGIITDERSVPIREVLVVIDPDSLRLRARSAADGRFRIPGVPPGRYEVRVVRIGFRPLSRTIEVAGSAVPFDVTMQSVPIPLDTVAIVATLPGLHGQVVTRGIALMPRAPGAVRGARIEAVNEPHSATTDKDGQFSMPRLGAGAHAVMVSREGYVTRLVPVSIAPDGGVEITVVLDSLYAEYQRRDEDQVRGISWRQHRAASPATFVPLHELDLEAKNLRDGIRYSNALLSRGTVIRSGAGGQTGDTICVYLNGKPRPDVFLQDLEPGDVEALEVYPRSTLDDRDRLPLFPTGSDCENLWGNAPLGAPTRNELSTGLRRNPNATRKSRANTLMMVVVWTRGRR